MSPPPAAPPSPPAPPPTPPPAAAEPDPRIDELTTKLQALARAQAKQGIVLDELARAHAQQHGELMATLPGREELGELLDVLDRLDDARRTLAPEQHALEVGLGAIAGLERVLAGRGVVRHAALGQPPQGRRERVVGSESHPELADGVIVRVVRAAASRRARAGRSRGSRSSMPTSASPSSSARCCACSSSPTGSSRRRWPSICASAWPAFGTTRWRSLAC